MLERIHRAGKLWARNLRKPSVVKVVATAAGSCTERPHSCTVPLKQVIKFEVASGDHFVTHPTKGMPHRAASGRGPVFYSFSLLRTIIHRRTPSIRGLYRRPPQVSYRRQKHLTAIRQYREAVKWFGNIIPIASAEAFKVRNSGSPMLEMP